MTPLDTLTLLRPKAEAGRAPTGDEAGPRAAPGFEAMLDAFEPRPAPTEPGAAGEATEGPPLPAPAEPRTGETKVDESDASLRDLMALAASIPAPPAPALPPEAALSAIVQRAVARAGVPVAEAPASAPRIALIGIETHFAPVRPHALMGGAPGAAAAGPAVPAPDRAPAAPPAPAHTVPAEWPSAATTDFVAARDSAARQSVMAGAPLAAVPSPRAAPLQGATPRPAEPAETPVQGGTPMPSLSRQPTAAIAAAAPLGAASSVAPEVAHAEPVTDLDAPVLRQAPPEAAAGPPAGPRIAATETRPVAAPSLPENRPENRPQALSAPAEASPATAAADPHGAPGARSVPLAAPTRPAPHPLAATAGIGAPVATGKAEAPSAPPEGSVAPSAAPAAHAASAPVPGSSAPPPRPTAATAPSSGTTTTERSAPPATAEACPADTASDPAVTAQSVLPAAAPADTTPPPVTQAPPGHNTPQPQASTDGTVMAPPAPAPVATGAVAAPPRPAEPLPAAVPAEPNPPAAPTGGAAPPPEAARSAPGEAPPLAATAPAQAASPRPVSSRAAGGATPPETAATTAPDASTDATPRPVHRTDEAVSPPLPGAPALRAAGERQAATPASRPEAASPSARGDGPDREDAADGRESGRSIDADVRPARAPIAQAVGAVLSPRALAGGAPGAEPKVGSDAANDPAPSSADADAGTMPAVAPSRPETVAPPQRTEPGIDVPLTGAETAAFSHRRPDDGAVPTDASPDVSADAPAEPRVPESPATTATAPTAQAGHPVPASPLRQIVDAVSAQFPAAAPSAPVRTAVPTEAGPLRILTLQLHPADLGTVLVRMRLQDGRLEMNLRTGREETAERLRREGGALSELLREAGYAPQSLTIETGGGAGLGTAPERGAPQNFSAGPQNGQSGGASADQPPGRRPSREGQETAPRAKEQDHDGTSSARDRDRGDLYL